MFKEMIRWRDSVPSASPSTLKRARPSDESSRAKESFKIPRVGQNAAAQESQIPQYMLTPPKDLALRSSATSLPNPTSNTTHEPPVPMAETFLELVDDPLAFLNILLSAGMEPDPLSSMPMSGDQPNPQDNPLVTE